jgi:hypothetical protein
MSDHRAKRLLLAVFASVAAALAGRTVAAEVPATGPSTRPATTIVIEPATEEGKKVLHATVTVDGKPLRDAKVQFGVARTFGVLTLGEDATDDDGVAAVSFPLDVPGNEHGELNIIATITSPAAYAGARQAKVINGASAVVPPAQPTFPRALWAPRAPLPLLLTVLAAIGGVWITYAFVIAQVLAIRRGGRS